VCVWAYSTSAQGQLHQVSSRQVDQTIYDHILVMQS